MHSKAESVGSRASALRLTRSVGRWPVAGASVARAFHCVAVNDQPALACAHTHTFTQTRAPSLQPQNSQQKPRRTQQKHRWQPERNASDDTSLRRHFSRIVKTIFFFNCHQVCVFFCVCFKSDKILWHWWNQNKRCIFHFQPTCVSEGDKLPCRDWSRRVTNFCNSLTQDETCKFKPIDICSCVDRIARYGLLKTESGLNWCW